MSEWHFNLTRLRRAIQDVEATLKRDGKLKGRKTKVLAARTEYLSVAKDRAAFSRKVKTDDS